MMKIRRFFKNASNERGTVLIGALIISTALVLIAGYQASRIVAEYRMADKSYNSILAANLAEAGINSAIWELNYASSSWDGWTDTSGDKSINVNNFTDTSGDVVGAYSVNVSNLTGSPVVSAIGYVPNASSPKATKYVTVTLTAGSSGSVFSYGIFGKDGLTLNSNARTDSYDSRNGAYGGTNVGTNGDVGTNATGNNKIQMNSNAQIKGDVFVGVGADPDDVINKNANVTVTGSESALPEEVEFPSVPSPTGLPSQGSIMLNSGSSTTITTSGEYSSISLNSNSHITIDGDVVLYVTGTLSLNSNTYIDIVNGGSLEIYVDGYMNFNSNAQINNSSQDPTKCILYGTDSFNGYLNFNSNTDFYGAIYAPNANLQLNSNAEIYGSAIGKTVMMNSNGVIHYDEALGESGVGPETSGSTTYTVTSWREK